MSPRCKPHMLTEYPLGYSKFCYETADSIETVEASGYFSPAAQFLRPRDIIELWADIASEPVHETYAVVAVDPNKQTVEVRRLDELRRSEPALPSAHRKPMGRSARGQKSARKE